MDIELIGNRIKQARNRAGMTQQQLADSMNIQSVSISNWERGKFEPKMAKLRQLADVLGVSVDYIVNGIEDNDDSPVSNNDISYQQKNLFPDATPIPNFVDVPVFDMRACAGLGTSHEYEDIEIERTLPLPAQLVGSISADTDKRPFAVHIDGDSMSAAGLHDKMLAIVNPCEDVHSGDVALVCYGSMQDVALKYVFYHQDGGVEIRSASEGYPIHKYSAQDCEPVGDMPPNFRIIGKVVGAWVVPKRG